MKQGKNDINQRLHQLLINIFIALAMAMMFIKIMFL